MLALHASCFTWFYQDLVKLLALYFSGMPFSWHGVTRATERISSSCCSFPVGTFPAISALILPSGCTLVTGI